jgi:hypothetical protein
VGALRSRERERPPPPARCVLLVAAPARDVFGFALLARFGFLVAALGCDVLGSRRSLATFSALRRRLATFLVLRRLGREGFGFEPYRAGRFRQGAT